VLRVCQTGKPGTKILKRKLLYAAMLAATIHLPAQAQEREWQLDAADQDVFLVFGVPATEDVGISFWCRIGTAQLSLFAPLPTGTNAASVATTEIQIGNETFSLKPVVNAEGAKPTLEAPLEPKDKFLGALKAAEKLKLTIAGHVSTFPLTGANFTGLMRLCENPVDQTEN
jgi:hypothetical protein